MAHPTAALLADVLGLALQHADGPALAKAYDRTFQFELMDGEPFYVELTNGTVSVHEGDSGLDWRSRDWQRVTCIHGPTAVVRDVLTGRRLPTEAYFARDLGFAPHRAATPHVSASSVTAWFFGLIRLAHEQAQRVGYERVLDRFNV
jgi:hypothetical protein